MLKNDVKSANPLEVEKHRTVWSNSALILQTIEAEHVWNKKNLWFSWEC